MANVVCVRFFYVFILDMNSNNIVNTNNNSGRQSKTVYKLLKSAIHRQRMKTPESNKSRTRKNNVFLNKTITNKELKSKNLYKKTRNHNNHNNNNNNHNNNNLKKYPEYLQKFIQAYYDSDKCVNEYLSTAQNKRHILPPARRIIVIGDIHGDFKVAIKCLILAGCIAPIDIPEIMNYETMDIFFKNLRWTGDDTHIVQLGDQIDRVRPRKWDINSLSQTNAHLDEGTTLEIFYLFWHLHQLAQQAKPNPGAVYCIIGNHEIMNVEGDFSYVSTAEFKSFKNHLGHIYKPNSKYPYHSRTLEKTAKTRLSKNLPYGYRERLYAFSPTGICSNFIAHNYYTLLQIGNWLFCHGSPTLSTLATYEIDLINTITSMYLLGLESDHLRQNPHNPQQNYIEEHFDMIMNNNSLGGALLFIIISK